VNDEAPQRRPAELYDELWRLLESSRFDDYMELFTEDCVMKFDAESEIVGQAATRRYFEGVMQMFPDIRHEVTSVIETDDSLAAEVRATATPAGPVPVGSTAVEARSGPARFTAVDLIWLRQGKVHRWHAYYDRMSMLATLGIEVQAR
jgi:predicted ester cyclase